MEQGEGRRRRSRLNGAVFSGDRRAQYILETMDALFRDARLKVERAKKHIEDLQAAIVALEDTYRATVEQHPDATGQSLIHEFPEIENAFEDLSLIIGDAIHNLRSALDFA